MVDSRLGALKHAALEAGKVIMKHYKTGVAPEIKPDKTFVSVADREAEALLLEFFKKEFPDYGILAEESTDNLERLSKKNVIVIDPIDGTRGFLSDNGEFCTMLALLENGIPIMGVIYRPFDKDLFFAEKGSRAHVHHQYDYAEEPSLIFTRGIQNIEEALVGHPSGYKRDKYERLYEALGIPKENIMPSGSMGVRMMQIAHGETDMILGYTTSLKEWDIAAGQPILEASGGVITDIYGNPLQYNKRVPKTPNGMIVAANRGLHSEIIARIKEYSKNVPL